MTGRLGTSGAAGTTRPARPTRSGTRAVRVFTRATATRLTNPCAMRQSSGWPGEVEYPAKTLAAVGRAHRVLSSPYGGHSMSAPTGVVCTSQVHIGTPKKTTNPVCKGGRLYVEGRTNPKATTAAPADTATSSRSRSTLLSAQLEAMCSLTPSPTRLRRKGRKP